MVASNSSNILTDAIADEDDDAHAADLLAAAEELDLDDDEDTAGSGSSSAVSLQSISVGQFKHFFRIFDSNLYSAASDGEAVEGDQEVIEDEDDDDEDEESDDDSDDDGSDGENEDLYAEMAMELEADNDVINGDNDLNDPGMGLHRPWLFYTLKKLIELKAFILLLVIFTIAIIINMVTFDPYSRIGQIRK